MFFCNIFAAAARANRIFNASHKFIKSQHVNYRDCWDQDMIAVVAYHYF